MTKEEAIKIFKGIEMVGGSLPEDGDIVEEALLMAIKALKVVKVIEDAYMSELLKTPMERNVPISDPCDGCQYELNSTNGNPCYSCGKYKLTEQQPCEDCISKEEVDTLVDELARAISDERCYMSRGRSTATIMQDLLNLPSVTPQQTRWIPVSERLPEEAYGCIVTVMDTNPMTLEEFENIYPDFVGWDGENWNDADGDSIPFEVIAWMPLPQPYKAESEVNADEDTN